MVERTERFILMDHLPGLRQHPLFNSYESWFEAVHAYMPRAGTPDRIGVREIQPGIWSDCAADLAPRSVASPMLDRTQCLGRRGGRGRSFRNPR